MLYSRDKGFLFIHLPKTGGTSVRAALQPYCGRPGILNYIGRRVERFPHFARATGLSAKRTFDPHTTLVEANALLTRRVVAKLYKFAITRHPCDRLVSFYRHILRHPEHPWYQRIQSYGDFETFAHNLASVGEPSQRSYLVNADGAIDFQYLGRLETLSSDFAIICKQIGVRCDLMQLNAAPNPTNLHEWYTANSWSLAVEYYREDFHTFGYNATLSDWPNRPLIDTAQ